MYKPIIGIGAALVALVFLISLGNLYEHQDAQEVMLIQSLGGKIDVYTDATYHWQGFGRVTKYPLRGEYEFKSPIRFNDGAQAEMHGSIQYAIPTDEDHIIPLYKQYGSPDAVLNSLMTRAVDKAIYMSGPLLSSKESYAEKRAALVAYVEDQVAHGIYMTRQRETKIIDPITGSEKTATAVEIVNDDKGLPRRQEEPVLTPFGIKTFGFTIKELHYDKVVSDQIGAQQQITMAVQTAIAKAKQAEQDALTAAKNGEAEAAKAKWAQEVIKAKFVTEAQQQLEVAQLDTKKAEQEKQAKLLRADGEAEYRKRIMVADGALAQKLDTLVKINHEWAEAMANFKGDLVPRVTMGTSSNGTANAAQTFFDIQNAKAIKDLSLDMSLPSTEKR